MGSGGNRGSARRHRPCGAPAASLGAVSPKLLQVYREGGLNLDQLMAFALTEDHGGWFEDAALLDRLVIERLRALATEVLSEGWKWAEAHTLAAQTSYRGGEAHVLEIRPTSSYLVQPCGRHRGHGGALDAHGSAK